MQLKKKSTSQLNVALIGYGKVGKTLDPLLKKRSHFVSQHFTSTQQIEQIATNSPEILEDIDVCIDFSTPEVFFENLKILSKNISHFVVGTTGWLQHIEQVNKLINERQLSLLFCANFSLGVFIFEQALQKAASLINKFDNYDVAGLEIHHNQKLDSPSGTAKKIGGTLLKEIERKSNLHYGSPPYDKQSIGFSSLRLGSEIGSHSVFFDSNEDKITISHQAKNRHGFATGAILGAEWIATKPPGFYDSEEFFKEIFL
jgi:4-hydroxy-tetrahydrodipicolinate reductase